MQHRPCSTVHLLNSASEIAFAGILPPVRKHGNIYHALHTPTSRQLLSSASHKHPAPTGSLAAHKLLPVSPAERLMRPLQQCGQTRDSTRQGAARSPNPQLLPQGPQIKIRDAHLAALHNLGCEDDLLQPLSMPGVRHAGSVHGKPSDAETPDRQNAVSPPASRPIRHAGSKPAKLPAVQIGLKKKQAVDMFGLGLNDHLQGKAVGLSILRPVSSLW